MVGKLRFMDEHATSEKNWGLRRARLASSLRRMGSVVTIELFRWIFSGKP
jgi:hypothetical protein